MLNDLDQYLTPEQAAEDLHIQADSVRALLRRGVLVGRKLGRDWFISRRELDAYRGRRRAPGRPGKE